VRLVSSLAKLHPDSVLKWRVVALLSAGLAIDYLARLGLYSVFPLLRKELIAGDVALGLVASSFPWTYGLLSPAAGFAGDRFARRSVIIASVAGWSVATMLCGMVGVVWQLVAARVLLAAAQVCYMPTAQAMIADFHGPQTRGKASGLYQAGSYVGIFLAGLPVAYVATRLGWRTMLFLSGALGLLIALLMLIWLPGPPKRADPAAGPDEKPVSVRRAFSLLRVPSMLVIMAAFGFAGITFWIVFTYLPLFIYERYRMSLEAAAFQATFYMQLSAMIAMPLFGMVSDAWTERAPRNRFLACAVVSALAIPALIAIGSGDAAPLLIAGLLVFGLAMAGTDASWLPMLCYVTRPRQRATAYGVLNTCSTVAGGCAAMATALVMKKVGLGAVIASLGTLFLLITILLIVVAYRLLPRDMVAEPDIQEAKRSAKDGVPNSLSPGIVLHEGDHS
jgi:MFS family permease